MNMVPVKVKDSSDSWIETTVPRGRYNHLTHRIRDAHIFFEGAPNNSGGEMSARDATEAEAFVIGQLTYLEAEAIRKWYTPMRYKDILSDGKGEDCIDYSAGAGAKAVDYLAVQAAGIGRRISPAGTDLPLVEQAYEKHTIGVAPGGIGYSYTVEDLRTAAILKQALPSIQQEDAVESYYRHMNNVALTGETASNFKGLYNNASATAATRASGAVWDSATPDTIVSDILGAAGAFESATQGNEVVKKIIFPITSYEKLLTPRSTNSDTTILSFIEKVLNVTILKDTQLETLGGSSSKRVVFVAPRKQNMVLHIPLPIEFLAPQYDGYRIVVPGFYKYAGFELRRILTARYMDGV
jgi:hypothetical protein